MTENNNDYDENNDNNFFIPKIINRYINKLNVNSVRIIFRLCGLFSKNSKIIAESQSFSLLELVKITNLDSSSIKKSINQIKKTKIFFIEENMINNELIYTFSWNNFHINDFQEEEFLDQENVVLEKYVQIT